MATEALAIIRAVLQSLLLLSASKPHPTRAMSQLRDRRHHTDSLGAQADLPGQPLTAHSQTDHQHRAAAAQDPPDPGAGPPAAADPAAAQQARGYKPGAAVLGVLRFALRETVYVGAIVVLAVWAAQSYFGQFTPDKVSGLRQVRQTCRTATGNFGGCTMWQMRSPSSRTSVWSSAGLWLEASWPGTRLQCLASWPVSA